MNCCCGPIRILILVLIATIGLVKSVRVQKVQKESPGVYANEIHGPRIYEKVGALTFEFLLPPQPNQENGMTFDYDCTDSNYSTDYSCPIFHHLHKLRNDIVMSMTPQRLHPESTTNEAFHIPSCDEVAPHFTTTMMSVSKLKKYQNLLGPCLDGLVVKAPLNLEYSEESTNKTYFTSMVQGFVENYYKLLPSTGRLDKAILLNAITINNALGFTKLIQDSQSIVNGWSTCQSLKIPSNFIPPNRLKGALQELSRLLVTKKMQLVIPNTDSDGSISEYYKIPGLADCVQTKKSLMVRILVPLKREEAEWKFYSLQSIPFIYNDGEDRSQLVCTVKDFDGQLYSFDSSSNTTFHLKDCDLRKSVLCHNGENPSSFMQNSRKTCASEIIDSHRKNFNLDSNVNVNDNTMVDPQLSRICDLNCEPSHLFRMPIMLRVASDKIYVAGQINQSISLECNSKIQNFYPPEEGALELMIPCGCKVSHQNVKFVGLEPCGRNLTVTIVRPVHLAFSKTAVDQIETVTPEIDGRDPRKEFEEIRKPRNRNYQSSESDED